MTYQPLARKYRPSRFADMVGQDSTAIALAQAISMGREPHALLFTGVRGVGKTTVARIYAKALNCSQRSEDAEPCDRCDSCQAITEGRHEDVVEIDGASNTGVNDVRSLQETIQYVPQRSRYKVYIIDEVHMLSQAAFNALLKTLEEPPSHVVFVFATTEIHKVPETILSRCQVFYLKKLTRSVIEKRLAAIVEWEGLSADPKALSLVAREGHGSMRDALTLLDQVIALSDGPITLGSLEGVISHQSSTLYLKLLKDLVAKDARSAFATIDTLDQSGAEFIKVVEETATLARHGFVLKSLHAQSPPRSPPSQGSLESFEVSSLGLDDEELATLQEICDLSSPFDLNRIFRTLTKARKDLDGSGLDRYICENYVFEWCLDPGLIPLERLLAQTPSQSSTPQSAPRRDLRSESPRPAGSPISFSASQPPQAPQSPPTMGASAAPGQTGNKQQSFAWPDSWRSLLDQWRVHKPLFARKLEDVHVQDFTPQLITLVVNQDSFSSRSLLQAEEQKRVLEQLKELFQFQGRLVVRQVSTEEYTSAGETVMDIRQKEAEQGRQRLIQNVKDSSLVRSMTSVLGATIEDVRMQEDRLT